MSFVMCSECGGKLERSVGPGRFRQYRGDSGYEIPAAIDFWHCPACGADWMAGDQIEVMGDAFEAERQRRLVARESGNDP